MRHPHGLRAAAKRIFYVGSRVEGFLGQNTDLTVNLTGLTGGIATAPATGDLVLVCFGVSAAAGVVNTTPFQDGWTTQTFYPNPFLDNGNNFIFADDTYDANIAVGYRRMGATPDTTVTFQSGTNSANNAGAVYISVWRGVNSTTPLDVTPIVARAQTNTVIVDANAITPTAAGSVIVVCGVGAHIAGTQTYSSSDLTDFRTVGSNDTNDVTIGGGYKDWVGGAFNPAAFTYSGTSANTNSCVSVAIALRPA